VNIIVSAIRFESEILRIDYLSLNLTSNNLEQIKRVANFLSGILNCRCILFDQSHRKKQVLIGYKCYVFNNVLKNNIENILKV